VALLLGGEHYRVWGEMLRSVTTGRPAFADVYGMPLPQYLASTPATAEAFDESMTGLTAQTVAATLAAYDFSQASRVVDVGGGHGALAMAILEAHPATTALILELPHVAERAVHRIGAAGLDGRCSAVAGDFRDAVPGSADLYILSRVLQGLDDAAAAALLTRCAAGLTDGGKVLMAEMVTANGNERVTRLEDLHMLVVTPGGRIRSEAEHAALFARAGLEVTRVLHTRTLVPFSLIEGASVRR
jgi:cyclopropane fatty-acyl-phospholipid synthase-like methyltransferase